MTSFLDCIVSGILCDVEIFAIMVKISCLDDIIAKLVTQVMFVILN